MDALDDLAALFKVLMHPTRLAILGILRQGEECVCHMEATLGLRQAYISQQLSVLREAGLVSVRRDGSRYRARVRCGGIEREFLCCADHDGPRF